MNDEFKVAEVLKIKDEKELYRYVIKMKAEDAINLLYALPPQKVKYACFIVFAFCDFYAKMDKEEMVFRFIKILEARLKKEKKFRPNILATLDFLLTGPLEKPPEKKNRDDEDLDQKDGNVNGNETDDDDE